MIKTMENLVYNYNMEKEDDNNLIYLGYLSNLLYDKAAKQYAKNNIEDEEDTIFLIEEYNDLVRNEHMNDCNNLFL